MSISVRTPIPLAGAALIAIGLCLGVPGSAEAARCDWSVKGTLQVEHSRLTKVANVFGDTSPLANIRVKVSARTRVAGIWGIWNGWPEERTDAKGAFEITNRKDCADRQIKVQVQFEDDALQLRHETATESVFDKVKWYEVVNDNDADRVRTSSTVNVGTLTFRPGGPLWLGDFEARRHAEMWHLVKLVMANLAAKGPAFTYKSRVEIKYPHDSEVLPNLIEASYVNPITKIVYIHREQNGAEDQFDVYTILHEIGHRWAYERFHGENCLTTDLVTSFNTHDLADDPCVAFHEGFADFWQQQLEDEILGTPVELPYNRAELKRGVGVYDTSLTTLDRMQRLDAGWWSVLTMLTVENLHAYEFGSATGTPGRIAPPSGGRVKSPLECSSPDIGFQNVLNVFHAHAGVGYPEDLDRSQTTIRGFIARANAILGKMKDEHEAMYVALANPAGTAEPADTLCSPITKEPIEPRRPLRQVMR